MVEEPYPTFDSAEYPEGLRQQWLRGDLRKRWATEHPDLFDEIDLTVALNQPNHHLAEWYAAILIKERHGLLSLVEKYGHHGARLHLRKQAILRKCVTDKQQTYLVTDPKLLFDKPNPSGWPDLFVYAPDFSSCFFCEVKSATDKLRPEQREVFDALVTATGIPVKLFQFRHRRRGAGG